MPSNITKKCLAFERHDHRDCQHQLIAKAKALCAQRDTRLTSRRLEVLEILLRSHQPMGAYEILADLNQNQTGQAIAPPIVYRALEFLLGEGLVHRIESKNAFISCVQPGHQCAAQFLICRGCEKVAELNQSDSLLGREAQSLGFQVENSIVEITGFCADCGKNAS